jgi:hypothetical protein
MRLFIATALLLAPALAAADDTRTTDVSKMITDDCARARQAGKPCVIDMGEGESIEAQTPTAGGPAIGIVEFARATSLVRVRMHFIPEILKSAEAID